MRPLRLTITAFGPYATAQVIDFTQLQGRNLFVITGDTGAGKTTILDAISYALYGKASGRDRDGDSLRSHFAHADLLTSVEMEFELQGTRYWVKRIPKQRKKRTRGEGYTDQNPEAEFKELGGESAVISGFKEVSEKIVTLMGLSYEQFKQIIMIPQGEFRELLNADSKARQDILQKIFGTEGLRRVQEVFESKAKALVQEVGALVNQRDECIRSLDSSSYLPLAEMIASSNYDVMLVMDKAQEAIVADENSGNELQSQINWQEEKVAEKLGEIFSGKDTNLKISGCHEALQKKLFLEADLPKFEEDKRIVEQGKKALALRDVDEYRRNRAIDVAKKTNRLSQMEEGEKSASRQVEVADQNYQMEKAKANQRAELLHTQGKLQGMAGKVADLDRQKSELIHLTQELKVVTKERENGKQELQQRRDNSILWQGQLDEGRVATAEYERKVLEVEGINRICHKLAELQEESERLITLELAGGKLAEDEIQQRLAYEQTQKDYEQAQGLFFEGQAGLLAAKLKMGEACPVCGSDHHPHLAIGRKAIPSEGELKKLVTKDKQARKLYDEIKSKYERNKGDQYAQSQIIARLSKEINGVIKEPLEEVSLACLIQYSQLCLAEYQEVKNNLQQEINQLLLTKNSLDEIGTRLQENTKMMSVLTTKLEKIEDQYTTLFAKVQSSQDAIQKLEGEVPDEVRSVAALEQELDQITKELGIMEQALNAAQEECTRSQVRHATTVAEKKAAQTALAESQLEWDMGVKRFKEALLAAGFADEMEYEKAKRSEEELTKLERESSEFQEKLHLALSSYEKAQQEVVGLLPVDILLLEKEQQNLQAEKNTLIEERTAIVARRIHNQTMLTTIHTLLEKIGKKDKEYQLIGHLARISKGDNEQKVSFERYVLAAFFNDIIDAANLRLKKMTGGRYQMSRMTQKGKGSGQSGLEIEVFDYYTGQSRHVKTLSGGESFKASLALALGLAEVVQSYAGGISLETMFVDEGFGTLDPESLDTAIACLIDLQHSGRLVGIISHVPELKTSIDARLEIEACKDGSHAKFYVF